MRVLYYFYGTKFPNVILNIADPIHNNGNFIEGNTIKIESKKQEQNYVEESPLKKMNQSIFSL